MGPLNAVAVVGTVFAIGYAALYKADDRNPNREVDVREVPLRFVSLMVVAFGSVAILALAFEAPETFGAGPFTTVEAIAVGSIFSVVGAATADSVF